MVGYVTILYKETKKMEIWDFRKYHITSIKYIGYSICYI